MKRKDIRLLSLDAVTTIRLGTSLPNTPGADTLQRVPVRGGRRKLTEKKGVRIDEDEKDRFSVSFCGSYSYFFFMSPSPCFRY